MMKVKEDWPQIVIIGLGVLMTLVLAWGLFIKCLGG